MKKNEDLKSEIEKAGRLSVENDSRVREAEQRLENFRQKGADIQARIQRLKTELSQREKEISEQVLTGSSVSVNELSKLRQKITEGEDEARIFTNVAEQAAAAVAEVQRKISQEHAYKSYSLVVRALREVNDTLLSSLSGLETLRVAMKLPGVSAGVVYHLRVLTGPLRAIETAARTLQAETGSLEEALDRMKDGTFWEKK